MMLLKVNRLFLYQSFQVNRYFLVIILKTAQISASAKSQI